MKVPLDWLWYGVTAILSGLFALIGWVVKKYQATQGAQQERSLTLQQRQAKHEDRLKQHAGRMDDLEDDIESFRSDMMGRLRKFRDRIEQKADEEDFEQIRDEVRQFRSDVTERLDQFLLDTGRHARQEQSRRQS